MRVDLQTIETKDGVRLTGMVAWPKRRRSEVGVVWVHGLSSTFYANLLRTETLAKQVSALGLPLAVFNTRGHDIVHRMKRKKRSRRFAFGGAAFEIFRDSIHDIRAVIDFLYAKGYKRIVLVGHSTGANKALYYTHKGNDRRIKGVALLSPLSDIAGDFRGREKELHRLLRVAKQWIARGDGDQLLPETDFGYLISARRFVSMYTPGGAEDVFPYALKPGNWKELKGVRVPMLVALGEHDEWLDRAPMDLLSLFQQHAVHARSFHGILISETDHGFHGAEQECAHVISTWIQSEM
jgi:alpha-beta hydrolase superfamily lysophospholipase